MPHNKILTIDDGHGYLCISRLGKIIEDDRIITKRPKLSYKYNGTFVIDRNVV